MDEEIGLWDVVPEGNWIESVVPVKSKLTAGATFPIANLSPINNLFVTSPSPDTDKSPFNDKSSDTINW